MAGTAEAKAWRRYGVGLIETLERGARPAAPVLPFGVAGDRRGAAGGGLARGALHEISGPGDEEDGAVAAAFLAGILGAARAGAAGAVVPAAPRSLRAGPRRARARSRAAGAGPGAARAEILWAMEEGLPRPGLAAVVGEVGALPRWRAADCSSPRNAPASPLSAAALARWRAGGARARSAERGRDPLAHRRAAVASPSATSRGSGARGGGSSCCAAAAASRRRWDDGGADATDHVSLAAALADRPAAPSQRKIRRAGRLSPLHGRRYRRTAASRAVRPGASPARSGNAAGGCALSPSRPRHRPGGAGGDAAALGGWRNGAAATAHGPLPMAQMGCGSRSPARPICGAGKEHSPPIWRPGSPAGASPRIAIADTLGAAWAMARFAAADAVTLVPPGGARPRSLVAGGGPPPRPDGHRGARRVGLKRIGDLYAMPRDALARAFGETVARRLDQALDEMPEPLSPSAPRRAGRVELRRADCRARPICRWQRERLAAAVPPPGAGGDGRAAARSRLSPRRRPGRADRLGTARPSRDPRHLAALFTERLDTIDPGLGIEDMILAAYAVEPLPAEQMRFAASPLTPTLPRKGRGQVAPLLDRLGETGGRRNLRPKIARQVARALLAAEGRERDGTDPAELAALLDRLANRLGLGRAVPPHAAGEPHPGAGGASGAGPGASDRRRLGPGAAAADPAVRAAGAGRGVLARARRSAVPLHAGGAAGIG